MELNTKLGLILIERGSGMSTLGRHLGMVTSLSFQSREVRRPCGSPFSKLLPDMTSKSLSIRGTLKVQMDPYQLSAWFASLAALQRSRQRREAVGRMPLPLTSSIFGVGSPRGREERD